MVFLCITTGISITGCNMRQEGTTKKITIKIQPMPYHESFAGERYKKYFMDQRLFLGIQKLKEEMETGQYVQKAPPATVAEEVNQVMDKLMMSDEEFAKLQKMIDETNLILAEQICQKIETDLTKYKYPISFVKENPDILIEVSITKTTRGTDFSMIIADIVTYKGMVNDKVKFSGQFDGYKTIRIETPEKISAILAKEIAKDLKKVGLI